MLTGRRTFILSFVLALTLLIAFAPQTDASASPAAVAPAHRRQANRMIKKRQGLDLGIIGVGEDPADPTGPTSGVETSETNTTATTTSTASGGITIPLPITTSSTSETETETETETTTSETSTSETETTSSEPLTTSESSSSSSSSEPETSAAPATSETLEVTPAPDVAALTTSDPFTSTVTNTHTAAQESATETATPTGATSISKTAITIIAVVGGSIVAVVVIWTIIRKWKLSPSDKFDDRLQPIDWSPDAQAASGAGLNRSASAASHGSFHSGSDHDSLSGPRRYAPHGTNGLVADLPAHDFTAGPAHLGGGYADLHRGPSPGPQMTSVSRGPSFNRGYGY